MPDDPENLGWHEYVSYVKAARWETPGKPWRYWIRQFFGWRTKSIHIYAR